MEKSRLDGPGDSHSSLAPVCLTHNWVYVPCQPGTLGLTMAGLLCSTRNQRFMEMECILNMVWDEEC